MANTRKANIGFYYTTILLGIFLFFTGNSQAATFGFLQIEDLLNPAKLEDNESAINESFDELWAAKADFSTATVSAGKRFVVFDLLNPAEAERNAVALNENFDELWREKVDVSGAAATYKRFVIVDLLNPERAEETTAAIIENFRDLWIAKEDKS